MPFNWRQTTRERFLFLWPWPWSDDLHIWTWSEDSEDYTHNLNEVYQSSGRISLHFHKFSIKILSREVSIFNEAALWSTILWRAVWRRYDVSTPLSEYLWSVFFLVSMGTNYKSRENRSSNAGVAAENRLARFYGSCWRCVMCIVNWGLRWWRACCGSW